MAAFGYSMVPQQYAAAMQYAAYGAAGYDMAAYQAALQQQQQQQLAAAQQAAAGGGAAAAAHQQQLLQQQQQQQAMLQQQAAAQQAAAHAQAQAHAHAQHAQHAQQAAASSSSLTVTGCANITVGAIVRGSYTAYTQNHERIVYRRTEQVNNLDVLVYYWDDRDGPNFCGWWFGPKVGGDQVWAYNPDKSMTPPSSGWRVPYDGPVDGTFGVAMLAGAPAPPAPPPPVGHQAMAHQQNFDIQAYYKKQEDERIRQQQVLEQQRRQVEEAKQLEEARKRQEEARMRLEQHAALTARKVIGDLKQATPETFAELCRVLQQVLAQELPRCGSMAQRVQQDAAEQIQLASQRVEGLKEQRRRDEERRVEEIRALHELQEESRKERAELVGFVEKAEATCGRLQEAAAPVEEGVAKLTASQAVDLQKAVTVAAVATRATCDEALAFLMAHRATLDPAAALTLQTQAAEAGRFVEEAQSELLKLQQRIGECLRLTITSSFAAKTVCERCLRKDVVARTVVKRAALFDKYDANQDGLLNANEVAAYAKGEFGFVVPADAMARVLGRLADNVGGVPKEQFHGLRVAIGVLRDEAVSRERLRKAEEMRKFLEGKKVGYQASAGAIEASLGGLTAEAARLEEKAKPLRQEAIAKLTSKEIAELLKDTEEQWKTSTDASDGFREKIKELERSVAEPELVQFMKLECRRLEMKLEHLAPRLAQVICTVEAGKVNLARQEQRELEQLKSEAAHAVKAHATEKKLSREDLLKAFDKDGDGIVSHNDFIGFLEGCEGLKLDRASLESLVRLLDEEGQGSLTQDVLVSFAHVFYQVVQDTVITTHSDIKSSKPIRRLETDEMIEALEGPIELEDVKIKRIRAVALKDGAEGWVTVQGNNDTVFLEERPPVFTLCAAVPLTKDLEASSEMLRQLSIGDFVEVLEWDRKDEAGRSRLRARTRGGDERLTGWLPGPASGEAAVVRLESREP